MGFYSTAAQVIPVLFLALIVEQRFFEPAKEALDPVLDLLVVSMFILGETLALWALAGGKPGRAVMAGVATPLAIGTFGLVAPIVVPRLKRVFDEAGSHRLPAFVGRLSGAVLALALYGVPLGFVVVLWLRAYV